MARIPKPSGAKKQLGEMRSSSSFGRVAGSRAFPKMILIICEGTETEYHYFQSLKQDFRFSQLKIEVENSGGKTAPINIVY